MKTTINVDEVLVREAMRLYGVTTKTRIIEMGLEELIKTHKRSLLAEAFGSQPELIEPRRRR
ncbi:MAG: type II toxin-antitoxin system VapB family antitoxin [Spirochaetaceae bacterium]|nr:MAG: type II toxin-antitoxin system VapB family antitoxin [Spirochaetaceae bacterium]